MAKTTLVITLVPGEQRRGLWCDQCALPSRIEQDFYSLAPWGVTSLTAAACTEHGRG